jgi:hypothetical protein
MSVRRIKAGTTDVSVTLRIIDSGDGTPETGVVFDTSGIDLWYRREGAASVDITEADLATPALTDAHADGGFLHINDGVYRLDLPDAACAAGVTGVQIGGTVTGMVVLAPYIELTDYNLGDLAGATFNTSTDSLEAIRNRGDAEWITGAGGTPPELLQATTIATLASQTSFTLTDGSADDGAYKDCTAVITDVATATQKCFGHIAGYVGSTKTVTLTVDPGVFTIATTDNIDIIAPSVAHALTAAAAAFGAINTHVDLFTTDSGQLLATAEPGSFAEQVSTLIGTPADTDIATDIANVQTEADKLGTPAGASVSADIAAAKSDTAAIKTKTDSLTFTVAGQVDANIESVNGAAVGGSGTEGSPWGPA